MLKSLLIFAILLINDSKCHEKSQSFEQNVKNIIENLRNKFFDLTNSIENNDISIDCLLSINYTFEEALKMKAWAIHSEL